MRLLIRRVSFLTKNRGVLGQIEIDHSADIGLARIGRLLLIDESPIAVDNGFIFVDDPDGEVVTVDQKAGRVEATADEVGHGDGAGRAGRGDDLDGVGLVDHGTLLGVELGGDIAAFVEDFENGIIGKDVVKLDSTLDHMDIQVLTLLAKAVKVIITGPQVWQAAGFGEALCDTEIDGAVFLDTGKRSGGLAYNRIRGGTHKEKGISNLNSKTPAFGKRDGLIDVHPDIIVYLVGLPVIGVPM